MLACGNSNCTTTGERKLWLPPNFYPYPWPQTYLFRSSFSLENTGAEFLQFPLQLPGKNRICNHHMDNWNRMVAGPRQFGGIVPGVFTPCSDAATIFRS
jgi:hypothetical protein